MLVANKQALTFLPSINFSNPKGKRNITDLSMQIDYISPPSYEA